MRRWALIAAAIALFSTGLGLGWWVWHPRPARVERAAPAQQLESGATVLAREPEAPVPPTITTAAKEAGGELVRAGQIVVRPKARESVPISLTGNSTPESFACSCSPVTLDWGLLRYEDGQRLVVQAEGGTVEGGVDIPLEPMTVPRAAPRWQVGALIPLDNPRGVGPLVTRRAGPLHVGVGAAKFRREGWAAMGTVTLELP